jgi:hypothetical protein
MNGNPEMVPGHARHKGQFYFPVPVDIEYADEWELERIDASLQRREPDQEVDTRVMIAADRMTRSNFRSSLCGGVGTALTLVGLNGIAEQSKSKEINENALDVTGAALLSGAVVLFALSGFFGRRHKHDLKDMEEAQRQRSGQYKEWETIVKNRKKSAVSPDFF